LDNLDEPVIDLESSGEHRGRNRRRGSEQGGRNLLSSWILAVQSREGHCVDRANVLLEMHKTSREHKHVSLLQRCGEQSVVSGDKANQESTLDHHQDFGGPRMCVRRVEAERSSEIKADQRNSQGV